MKIKHGVDLRGLKLEMRNVLILVDLIYKKREREVVVTSGLEGEHSAGSLHYYGYALDFRVRDIPRSEVQEIVEEVVAELEIMNKKQGQRGRYRAKLEIDHLHVEYMPWDIYLGS